MIPVGQPHMIQAMPLSLALQFAMSIGDAYRANMIAFGEQHLEDHFAVPAQAVRLSMDDHAIGDARGAGRDGPRTAGHVDDA